MLSTTIFTDKRDDPTVTDLESNLAQGGFRIRRFTFLSGEDVYEDFEGSSAFVAVLTGSRPNHSLLLHLAYLIGRQKPVWIICKDINTLPPLLRKASYLPLDGENIANTLIDQIRTNLRIDIPAFEVIHDLELLTSWLGQSPDRITGLSAKDFERVVFHLLADIGLRYETNFPKRTADLVFSEPATRNLLLVEAKNYLAGKKVGVGTIQRSVANALSLGCDFTVIVSANDFTRSATEFAKLCAPPVWLLGRDSLELWIKEKLEPDSKVKKNPGKLFSWLLNRQDETAHAERTAFRSRPLLLKAINDPYMTVSEEYVSWWQGSSKHRTLNKCELFFSFAKGTNEEEIGEHVIKFIGKLEGDGVRVWHDIPELSVGSQCKQLSEVAMAVRRSSFVLLFLGNRQHQSVRSMKTCQTVASELSKARRNRRKIFVIGPDNLWSRLQLPALFYDSVFLNPSEPRWQSAVYDLCQEAADDPS